jgi:hypothetical protein
MGDTTKTITVIQLENGIPFHSYFYRVPSAEAAVEVEPEPNATVQ